MIKCFLDTEDTVNLYDQGIFNLRASYRTSVSSVSKDLSAFIALPIRLFCVKEYRY
jgi:hypothetical protein